MGHHIRQNKRLSVFHRDGWTCTHCGRAVFPKDACMSKSVVAEIDHLLPIAVLGYADNCLLNLATSCRRCNLTKGDFYDC